MRKRLYLAAQILFVGAALAYASVALGRHWEAFAGQVSGLRPDWGLVFLSGGLVLLAYAVLIQTWRVTLRAWDASLPYGSAARIWFVSNLGKYVPGKVWQIAAMSLMARARGVPVAAAAGSSLLVNLVNVFAGAVLVLLIGAGTVVPGGSGTRAAVILAAVLATALALVVILPRAAGWSARILGRSLEMPRIPISAVWRATLGTAAAWMLYGVAFERLAHAVLPGSGTGLLGYVAVYAASYLAGYLTPLAPGGLVVRESILAQGLVSLGLTGESDAWVLAFASRLWLTALEIAPAVLFIAAGRVPRSGNPDRGNGPGQGSSTEGGGR